MEALIDSLIWGTVKVIAFVAVVVALAVAACGGDD
jgi:hypothetical protein